jgi:hypothetical protein
MFLCCLGSQLAARVDPDAIRNAIPFITHRLRWARLRAKSDDSG